MMKTHSCLLALIFACTVAAQDAVAVQDDVVLQGRVVNMLGEPIVAAVVAIAAAENPTVVVARTSTDGSGLFRRRVKPLPVGKAWRLTAESEGWSCAEAVAFTGDLAINFVLHDAVALRGTILDPAGEPVAGVHVYAHSLSPPLRTGEHTVTTDDGGRFEGLVAPVGPVVIGAFVPGHGMLRADLIATEDAEVKLAPVDGDKTSIEIKITGLPDGERPPAILKMMGYGGNPRLMLPRAMRLLRISGDSWRMDDLPDWRYRLDARSSGYSMSPPSVRMPVVKGPHRVELKAVPATAEQTTVVAEVRHKGRPVKNAKMSLTSFGANVRVVACTDDEGRVTFVSGLARGSRAIIWPVGGWVVDREFREGHSGLLPQECIVEPDKVIAVPVVPASVVGGRLLLPDGKPAVFVEVGMRERTGGRTGYWRPVASVSTDGDGRFRFAPQIARKNPIRLQVASASGSAVGEPFSIREPGTDASELELELLPPSVVSGLVTGQDGKPAVGVILRLSYPRREDAPQRVSVVTDKLGRYRIATAVPGKALMTVMQGTTVNGAFEELVVAEGQDQRLDLKASWLRR